MKTRVSSRQHLRNLRIMRDLQMNWNLLCIVNAFYYYEYDVIMFIVGLTIQYFALGNVLWSEIYIVCAFIEHCLPCK